eukprot:2432711-Pyramimonas_sp.AAC.1
MADGNGMNAEFNDCLALFIPKGDFDLDGEEVQRGAGDMRPLSLRSTDNKVIASVLADKLARVARKAVPSSQRGF